MPYHSLETNLHLGYAGRSKRTASSLQAVAQSIALVHSPPRPIRSSCRTGPRPVCSTQKATSSLLDRGCCQVRSLEPSMPTKFRSSKRSRWTVLSGVFPSDDEAKQHADSVLTCNLVSRIHVLAGRFESSLPALNALSDFLVSPNSFHNVYRPSQSASYSSVIGDHQPFSRHINATELPLKANPFFTYLTIFATSHTQWEIDSVPAALRLVRERIYSDDIFDKRVPEVGTDAPLHRKYGVDLNKGAIVVVRPDGYVGAVVQLNADGFSALNAYFQGFLLGRKKSVL